MPYLPDDGSTKHQLALIRVSIVLSYEGLRRCFADVLKHPNKHPTFQSISCRGHHDGRFEVSFV